MQRSKIDALARVAYSRSINPLKRITQWHAPIVGFDTEYDSRTRELISIQLSNGDTTAFIPWPKGKKLNPGDLWKEVVSVVERDETEVLLVTFFSIAELQFLPVVRAGHDIREYANGSLDVSFTWRGRTMRVFDLARWFGPGGLAGAAKAVGLRKLDFDTRHVSRRCLRDARFIRYAKHDAWVQREILVRLRDQFLEETGIDPVTSHTPANTSARVFRSLYCRRKLYCDSNEARILSLKGTWGGRAEVYRRGALDGQYTEWDITSAYPMSAIRLREMPVQGSWSRVSRRTRLDSLTGGFLHVRFRFGDDCRYPCLPTFTGTHMVYPLRGVSSCTVEEVRHAIEVGAEIEILDGWGYRKGTTILRDYMQWTLEQRKKAKGGARHMWKLLANSIIGKFCQQVQKVPMAEYERVAKELGCLLDELFELNHEELRALGIRTMPQVGSVFMPEWNGLITGYTRAALAQMIETGRAVYCHTDSVWCKGTRKPKCDLLPFERKGKGRVVIVRTRFAGLVNGKSWGHVPHHSVWGRKSAVRILSRFDGGDNEHEYTVKRPVRLRESLRHKRTFGAWEKEKRTASTHWDHKRRLLPSGDTRPWRDIEEMQEHIKSIQH